MHRFTMLILHNPRGALLSAKLLSIEFEVKNSLTSHLNIQISNKHSSCQRRMRKHGINTNS